MSSAGNGKAYQWLQDHLSYDGVTRRAKEMVIASAYDGTKPDNSVIPTAGQEPPLNEKKPPQPEGHGG